MQLRDAQIALFRKFGHLYDSGVPIAEALELAAQGAGPVLADAVGGIVRELYAGTSLAGAMEKRHDAFSPELVGILRVGEERGELGQAARNAATGLRERFLEPRRVAEAEIDSLLENAGDARFLHLEPGDRLRIRTTEGLSDGGPIDTGTLAPALARRGGIAGDAGVGAFVWRNRLLRVSLASTPDGPSAVVRLSDEPGPEPAAAAAWRTGRPGLLVVLGGRHVDKDACFRSILAAFDPDATRRVAVDLPCPEAVDVPDLATAAEQDPDVLCIAQLVTLADLETVRTLLEDGVRTVVGAPNARLFRDLPHRLLRP